MAEFVVYLRVQPTDEDRSAMDSAFDFMLPRVIYVTDGVAPDVVPSFSVEYSGLVGEKSGHRYVTLHYDEGVVIKASFSGLGMAALASEIGNRTLEELVDKADHSPDEILHLHRGPFQHILWSRKISGSNTGPGFDTPTRVYQA
nr:hypothetical protein BGZ76_004249 [Entomortierella beljakovae]